jgi:U3 small nucleolar RNA-associated protein 20
MRPLPRKYLPAQRNASQTKKHRFEPFSQRIARLKIDPVRRSASRHALDASDSFFKSSLESWIDLNLSAHFTAFCKRVEPYCDSLPQIIHHADDIANTLVSYLQNGTEVSLEPLLDLVAQLAHDLGQRFEIHFSKIVETISHIASSNPHVQVIEWSFNCLAWLFKYLSRLLVPDLRPLFDLIAPLLGQERQKEFVTRFAAEAFSYLIRRASISYHKDKEPLRRIVKHILSKVLSAHHSGTSSCSTDALCTLFGESIKGVNGELSSNGDIIFHEILSQYLVLNDTDSLASESVFPILKGILDSMIVYSTSKAFRDILRALISNAHSNKLDYNEGIEIIAYNVNTLSQAISRQRISTCVELLLLPVCANEGEVIEDWGSIFSFIELVVGHINSYQELFTIAPQILSLLAASHGTAPIDASIPHNRVFQTISNGSWTPYFLGVCEIYAQLDHGRFLTFLQPYFKRYWFDYLLL